MRNVALAFVLLASVATASGAFARTGQPTDGSPAKVHVTHHRSKAKVARSENPTQKPAVVSGKGQAK
jgi:hypothetical protein